MEKLNKRQMKAYNNLGNIYADFQAGKASIEELKNAKEKYDKSLNYKPILTGKKARTLGAFALTGVVVLGASSCTSRTALKDQEVNTEATKTEAVTTDMNSEIKNHEDAFEEGLVLATEEVLTKNVLSEDFFGTTFQEDPELYTDNLTRLVEMTARYKVVNSVIEDKPVFTPTDLAVLDKDGSLPTVTEFTNDAQLGETNMEMLLTVAAYQNPAVDYSNFFVKKADINYINNITNMINKLSKGMQANDEKLVEDARQELLVEKDKLVTNDPSLASINYVAIKEAFQKIEIANMSVEVLTTEEQGIINHLLEEKCDSVEKVMTELDVKGSYIYHVMEEYLAKYTKIDASMYDGLTWDELIADVTDKVLEDILNKKITPSFFNEQTNTFTIINNYLNAKIEEVSVYGYTIVNGGGCVTTKVKEETKTETKVVKKEDVPEDKREKDVVTYHDPKGNVTTKEEIDKKADEKQKVLEEIGESADPEVPVEYIDDPLVKEAIEKKQEASEYREEVVVPYANGKEEIVTAPTDVPVTTNSVEPTAPVVEVTTPVAEPTRAISSIAIDENGNTYNESYHAFYDEDIEYFGDDEIIMTITTDGGMSK